MSQTYRQRKSLHDLKTLGLPEQRAPMSDRMRWFVRGCLAVIALGTAYSLTNDEPERKVVLTPAEYTKAIADARIAAARETMEAVGTCGWRDLWDEKRQPRKGAM